MRIRNYSIENILVAGKLAEFLYMINKESVRLDGDTEARCRDTVLYNSGEYVILQSGSVTDRYAGVLFIIHRPLEGFIVSFTPISVGVAALTLRAKGGAIMSVLAYLPYEAVDNQDFRVATYDE